MGPHLRYDAGQLRIALVAGIGLAQEQCSVLDSLNVLETTNGRGGVDFIVPVGQQYLAIERRESLQILKLSGRQSGRSTG